jgi:ankyrin repeat protein
MTSRVSKAQLNEDLLDAVENNMPRRVSNLLKAGASPNGPKNCDCSTLYIAASKNNLKIVRALIKAGVEDEPEPEEPSALTIALQNGNIEIAEALLKYNPYYLGSRDEDGFSPIELAAYQNDVELINLIFTFSDNIDNTWSALENSICDGKKKAALAIIERAADWYEPEQLESLLGSAFENDQPEIFAALVDAGADPSEMEDLGRPPLLEAIQNKPDFIECLLDNGFNANETDEEKETPLMYAVRYRPTAKFIQMLIKAGAKKKLKNAAGDTAYDIATKSRKITDKAVLDLIKPTSTVRKSFSLSCIPSSRKNKPPQKPAVITKRVRRRFVPDPEQIADSIKEKTKQHDIFSDIASLLAERLRQKEPTSIDCGDEGTAANFWEQFCYLAANSDPEGYPERFVKSELEILLNELDLDTEDWEFLWLGTEYGDTWVRQHQDPDLLPPVDDHQTIDCIYYGFVLNLAETEGNGSF